MINIQPKEASPIYYTSVKKIEIHKPRIFKFINTIFYNHWFKLRDKNIKMLGILNNLHVYEKN